MYYSYWIAYAVIKYQLILHTFGQTLSCHKAETNGTYIMLCKLWNYWKSNKAFFFFWNLSRILGGLSGVYVDFFWGLLGVLWSLYGGLYEVYQCIYLGGLTGDLAGY